MRLVTRLACVLLFTGCIRDDYQLELIPAGDSMDRRLTYRPQKFDAAQTQRLADLYRVEAPPPGEPQVFAGRFAGTLPGDIGGNGRYLRWESSLGSATVYLERFRGDDDLARLLERRQAAARRMGQLISEWLQSELKDEPGWPSLQEFLEGAFRRDLVNLSLYAVPLSTTENPDEAARPAMRIVQYLLERDYLRLEDVPAMQRAFDDLDRDLDQRALQWMTKLIAQRMKPSPREPDWTFLAKREQLLQSLTKFLESTDEHHRHLDSWREQRTTSPQTPEPSPLIVAGDLLNQMFYGTLRLGGDQLAIRLASRHQPLSTNGEWDASANSVIWKKRYLPDDKSLPEQAFAVWVEPDEQRQTKLFGRQSLTGQQLLQYCLWYQGLTDSEQLEWEAFLNQLSPADAVARLKQFRFSSELASTDANHSLARQGVTSLLHEMTP